MSTYPGLQDIQHLSNKIWLPNNHLELDGSIYHWWYSYLLRIWFYNDDIILSDNINKS